MKIVLNDPHIGRREIDSHDLAGLVKDQLNVLRFYLQDGRKPTQHLKDDIATYEYILAQPNPRAVARKYFDTKSQMIRTSGKRPLNYEVADRLGWPIREGKIQ